MARPKPTEEDLENRATLAAEVKFFLKKNLFTEQRFAETVGISRRSVQMIKAAGVSPNRDTLHKIESLFKKYKFQRNKVA